MKTLFKPDTKTTVTIRQPGFQEVTFEFVQSFSLDVKHEVDFQGFPGELRMLGSQADTVLTIKGRLTIAPPKHAHIWEPDGFGAVREEDGITHHGLKCACGATACGTLSGGEYRIVHNIRE